jgi:hypothetical protein
MTERYYWQEAETIPARIELMDKIATNCVAVIAEDEQGRWHWKRSTSQLMHGAPPIEGSSASLPQAKRKVLQDLPDHS